MIDKAAYLTGIAQIAAAVRQRLLDADIEAYDSIRKDGRTEDWTGYVEWCLDTLEFRERFPILADLRDSFERYRREHTPSLPGTVGKCQTCEGRGFEYFERDGRTWTRPCECRMVKAG